MIQIVYHIPDGIANVTSYWLQNIAGRYSIKIKRAAIGKILRQLCEWKGVKIIEAEACPNYIHLHVEIPPKIAVPHFVGYLN